MTGDIWALKAYEWPQEYKDLITWFYANQDILPRQKFTLPEYKVDYLVIQPTWAIDEPDQYYRVLRVDIDVGPHRHPTTSGMLLFRLRHLKEIVYNPPPRVDIDAKTKKMAKKSKEKKRIVTEDELSAKSLLYYEDEEDDYGQE
jgi:hypothetical protein